MPPSFDFLLSQQSQNHSNDKKTANRTSSSDDYGADMCHNGETRTFNDQKHFAEFHDMEKTFEGNTGIDVDRFENIKRRLLVNKDDGTLAKRTNQEVQKSSVPCMLQFLFIIQL